MLSPRSPSDLVIVDAPSGPTAWSLLLVVVGRDGQYATDGPGSTLPAGSKHVASLRGLSQYSDSDPPMATLV